MLWPTTVSAPSAQNYLDHFPGSSLNGRWSTITSGTGSTVVSDSYVACATGGTGGAGAIYLATKIDKTKNILIQACVSSQHTSGGSDHFFLVNKATAPVADTYANFHLNVRAYASLLQGGGGDEFRVHYYDATHTKLCWDGASWTTTQGPMFLPCQADDYHVVGLEIDGKAGRFRFLGWNHKSAGGLTFDQGLRLYGLSDWVLFSTMEATADLWLVLGNPFSDGDATKEFRYEWVRYAEDTLTMVETWCASKDAALDGHAIRHGWSHDGVIFVPQDRTSQALAFNAPNSWESFEVQAPSVSYDGVNTDYMAYCGMNSAFTESGIGIAKAPHMVPQNGPWTRGASNPVLSAGAGEDKIRYPFMFKDDLDPDPNKRWKLLVAVRQTADQKQRMILATAPDPPDTSAWTKQGTIIDAGTGADLDAGGMESCCVAYVNGRWDVYYEGIDSGGLSRVLRASGPTLTALTKEAGVAYVAHQASGDSALTAALTNSRTVTVASTTGFVADSFVAVDQDTDYDVYGASRLRKVVSSTELELYHALDGFTTALPAHIRQIDRAPHHAPRCVIRIGSEWWFFSINYGFMDGNTGINALCEQVVLHTHAGALPSSAIPTLTRLADPVLTRSDFGAKRSAENFSLFNQPLRYPPQYAFPVADVTDGTWLNQAGSATNLYASIDDPELPLESDYVQSALNPAADLLEVQLAPLSDPLRGDGHVVRYQARLAAAGRDVDITVELRQGASALSTPASWVTTLSTAVEGNFAHVLSAAQADAITNYGDLRLRVSATQGAAAAPTFVAAGTASFTATNGANLTPGLPSGWAPGDIHVLLAHRSDNTAMTALGGWTSLSAANNTAAQRVEVWWRRAVAGDTAPTVTFGTSTVVRGARIFGVRGCPGSGDPFSVALSRSNNAASATITFSTITPPDANTRLLALYAYEDDPNAASQISGWSTFTVGTSSLGADMAIGYAHREWAAASTATGGLTSTASGGTFANSPNVGVILSLKPTTTQARLSWAQLEVPYSPFPATFPRRTVSLRR